MRLDSALIAAAEREAAIQKRSIPKQIEFWAELGKAVEHLIGFDDVIAVTQGLKKIELAPLSSSSVAPDDVFDMLESKRAAGTLSDEVTGAAVYYEASRIRPGLLDRVDAAGGKRETGRFQNGEFRIVE
jgi:ABC-type amino acid transport substrate-binding protein